jgi:asparagine synthase (glutamine-hydrolysing)
MVLDDRASGQPRYVLAYNGELYNDAELRRELETEGVLFRTACDTETVLHALARWGLAARRRLRGMYALALWDARENTLLLARDELGIKPLYLAALSPRAMAFASEPAALFEHPGLSPHPDWPAVAAYLGTIQVTLATRTLFAGVETLEPGQWLTIDASGDELRSTSHAPEWHTRPAPITGTTDAVTDAVARHLRADVPTCALLSGGLDSSIISALALDTLPALDTYCAGAPNAGERSEDFAFAKTVAAHIGSRHTEAPVSKALFADRWHEMVQRTGLPLCTPNEVAINHVARTLKADGKTVTLSGEGADELFGGYHQPLALAAEHIASTPGATDHTAPDEDALAALASITWTPADQQAALLTEPVHAASAEGLAMLGSWFAYEARAAHEHISADFPRAPLAERRLQAVLRLQRRVNLANLLRRLDQATMLTSVEGRTPFADRDIARLAETLPLADKFVHDPDPTRARTKITLRRAFASRLPPPIVARPKASFPLPFESWLTSATPALDSAFAREVFTPAAREQLRADPADVWTTAWPALNIALWGQRWWGT